MLKFSMRLIGYQQERLFQVLERTWRKYFSLPWVPAGPTIKSSKFQVPKKDRTSNCASQFSLIQSLWNKPNVPNELWIQSNHKNFFHLVSSSIAAKKSADANLRLCLLLIMWGGAPLWSTILGWKKNHLFMFLPGKVTSVPFYQHSK